MKAGTILAVLIAIVFAGLVGWVAWLATTEDERRTAEIESIMKESERRAEPIIRAREQEAVSLCLENYRNTGAMCAMVRENPTLLDGEFPSFCGRLGVGSEPGWGARCREAIAALPAPESESK